MGVKALGDQVDRLIRYGVIAGWLALGVAAFWLPTRGDSVILDMIPLLYCLATTFLIIGTQINTHNCLGDGL